jgi:hypothetical protein
VNGKEKDKAQNCGFKVFYRSLKTAPMIEQTHMVFGDGTICSFRPRAWKGINIGKN